MLYPTNERPRHALAESVVETFVSRAGALPPAPVASPLRAAPLIPGLAPGPTAQRLPMADAVRLICVAWVMWIHIPDSAALAPTTAIIPFRLPVFVMLSTFFLFVSQRKHPSRSLFRYAVERVRNLYLPFLGWAAIYYLLHACIDRFIRHDGWPAVSRGILFHGQTVHLWFVPFIVAAGILTFPATCQLLRHAGHPIFITVFASLAGLVLAAAAPALTDHFIDYRDPIHIKEFLYRVITLAPSIPLGVAAYFLFEHLRLRFGQFPQSIGRAGLYIFCVCLLVNCFIHSNPLLESIAGFAVVLIALCPTHNRLWLGLASLGRYAFGMYLVHMLFVDCFKTFRESIIGITPRWWYDLLVLFLCVPLSLLFSIALSRNRYTRWLAPAGSRGDQKKTDDLPKRAAV